MFLVSKRMFQGHREMWAGRRLLSTYFYPEHLGSLVRMLLGYSCRLLLVWTDRHVGATDRATFTWHMCILQQCLLSKWGWRQRALLGGSFIDNTEIIGSEEPSFYLIKILKLKYDFVITLLNYFFIPYKFLKQSHKFVIISSSCIN